MKHLSKIKNRQVTDSPIEEILYDKLCQFGLKPTPQYIDGSFRIDLAFPEKNLAIELDGKQYHMSKEQKQRDNYRQKKLEDRGWKFERFNGRFIKRNPDVAVAKIALKYFANELNCEQKRTANGSVVRYFTSPEGGKDLIFAERLVNRYLEENFEN